MKNQALVIIDIQNDITKNYRDIVENINQAIDWAVDNGIHVVYIVNHSLSASARTFRPGTRGAQTGKVCRGGVLAYKIDTFPCKKNLSRRHEF